MQEAYLLTYEIKINLPLTKRFEMREFLFLPKQAFLRIQFAPRSIFTEFTQNSHF